MLENILDFPFNPNKETNKMPEKYCKDCVHYEDRGCHNRDDAIDLLSGEKTRLSAIAERRLTHHSDQTLTKDYKPCGWEAEHFEPRAE